MIQVNGKAMKVNPNLKVAKFLQQEGYDIKCIAVEKNGCILPKEAYDQTLLKDGDVLEIVSFVGGG